MIDLTLDQPLLAGASSRRAGIAPGLLRVLKQAAAIRLVMALLAAVLIAVIASGRLLSQEAIWLPVALSAEAVLYLGFVTWTPLRVALGRWFLPAALGWFLVAPVVEQGLLLTYLVPVSERLGRNGPPGIGVEVTLMWVPVILATWQYGRRGLFASLAAVGLAVAALTALLRQDALQAGIYVVGAVGILAMLSLLGYVVLQLVGALRAEHAALVAANRRLAQRAATVEQLAESRERNRLARELHDTLAHSLTGLSVQLQAIETLQAHDPQAAASQLKQAQATVRNGIQESRRAIQALRAAPLEELGLASALRQFCRRFAERTDIPVVCDVAEVGVLDPLTEQAIYRVAEAALANVEQHAAASQVQVALTRTAPASALRLEVTDNGAGFDRSAVAPERYGLTGMAEWAELAGADLQIETAPGQGTRVALEARQ
jgi:signal transduction histidine kinase